MTSFLIQLAPWMKRVRWRNSGRKTVQHFSWNCSDVNGRDGGIIPRRRDDFAGFLLKKKSPGEPGLLIKITQALAFS
ncbi:hypothetical protein [Mesorhizobium sp. CA16]|uniref:hypothetical protein n=1 Tax=Mesorhizobium sp. CA16 TaxID=588496 RepID=UPI001CCA8E9D|nr:hypothetical protein [Mesorhizobium sp. CA16]MBZ9914130.1 hypothetical protein [Mesorhizobium sp. CA16]